MLLIGTWAAVRLDLDHQVARLFFTRGDGWIYRDGWPWKLLHDYGTIPGLLLTMTALAVFGLGLIHPKWQSWRRPMLVIGLTSILGAGVLVNAILKPYCGRPRPREVIEYNGQWEYCLPCFDSEPGKGMSFPCGHCTMGFLFVTLAFCRRNSRLIAYAGAGFGLVFGIIIGVARAAQGAHFVTDIFWSLGTLVITSLVLYYLAIPLIENFLAQRVVDTPRKKVVICTAFCLAAVAITTIFLTRRPYYEMASVRLQLSSEIQQLVVATNVDLVKTEIEYKGEDAQINLIGQGFAFPNAQQRVSFTRNVEADSVTVGVLVHTQGYFSELRHHITLSLPLAVKDRIALEFQ